MGNWILGRINTIDEEMRSNMPTSNTTGSNPVDTCLKYSPFILLFALQQRGFKTKNGLKSETMQLISGCVMLEVAARLLKKVVNKERPNGRSDSFPSAHTATCILGAELLRHELKERYPALSYSGYLLAIMTALLRMYHNKHWFSDIMAGALLGFVSFTATNKMYDKANRRVVSE